MTLIKVKERGRETVDLGRRNLVINGDMKIAQRGTVSSLTNGYGGADRFQFGRSGSAVVTLSKDTDVPTGQGFTSSQKVDVTTADSSLAAGDYAFLRTKIEGQNLQHLLYGTSSAKKVTLQFFVKSSKTGTHIVELYHGDVNYFNSQAYTIASANTWQKVTMTFDGYQPSVINNDNGIGFQIAWWLAAGSTYTSGTLSSNTWHNDAAGRAPGQVNVMDNTANNFYLTGVQLEVGDTSTDFEHRSFAEELSLCQRYLYRRRLKQYDVMALGHSIGGNLGRYLINLPTAMRIRPSVSDGGDIACWYSNAGAITSQTSLSNIYMPSDETNFNQIYLTAAANATIASSTYPLALTASNGSANADSYVQLDAEL